MRYFVLVVLILVAVAVPSAADHPFRLHWQKRDPGRVTVFLVDHTQGRFPVTEAIHRWNGTGAIHLATRDACPPNRGCVQVRLRAMRYLGLTTLHNDGQHLTRVDVDLSSTRRMSSPMRLSITCHELGHALGLSHRQATSSCLHNTGRHFPLRPDAHDHDQLRLQYSHEH